MTLKAVVPNLDEVEAQYHPLYVQIEDKEDSPWILDVEEIDNHPQIKALKNAFERQKVTSASGRTELDKVRREFSDLQTLIESLGGTDKLEEALNVANQLKDKKLLDEGKMEEVVAKRMEPVKSEFAAYKQTAEGKIGDLTKQLEESLTRHKRMKLEGIMRDVAIANSARPKAIPYILSEALNAWSFPEEDSDTPVLMQNGEMVYGKNGEPMSPGEWIGKLSEESPFLFEENAGAGATGGKHSSTRKKTIRGGDPKVMGQHLEDIASGKVTVIRDDA